MCIGKKILPAVLNGLLVEGEAEGRSDHQQEDDPSPTRSSIGIWGHLLCLSGPVLHVLRSNVTVLGVLPIPITELIYTVGYSIEIEVLDTGDALVAYRTAAIGTMAKITNPAMRRLTGDELGKRRQAPMPAAGNPPINTVNTTSTGKNEPLKNVGMPSRQTARSLRLEAMSRAGGS